MAEASSGPLQLRLTEAISSCLTMQRTDDAGYIDVGRSQYLSQQPVNKKDRQFNRGDFKHKVLDIGISPA